MSDSSNANHFDSTSHCLLGNEPTRRRRPTQPSTSRHCHLSPVVVVVVAAVVVAVKLKTLGSAPHRHSSLMPVLQWPVVAPKPTTLASPIGHSNPGSVPKCPWLLVLVFVCAKGPQTLIWPNYHGNKVVVCWGRC